MNAKTIFATLALLGAVAADTITFNTPASLVECQPVALSWTGGTAPYIIAVIPGGEPSAAALETIDSSASSTSETWTVNIASGTSVSFKVTDSTGTIQYSDKLTIQAGSSDSCLTSSASGSSTAASASSSAASDTAAVAGSASTSSAAASSAAASTSAAATSAAASSAAASSAAASTSAASSAAAATSATSKASSAAASSSTTKAASTSASASASASSTASGAMGLSVPLPAVALALIGGAIALF